MKTNFSSLREVLEYWEIRKPKLLPFSELEQVVLGAMLGHKLRSAQQKRGLPEIQNNSHRPDRQH